MAPCSRFVQAPKPRATRLCESPVHAMGISYQNMMCKEKNPIFSIIYALHELTSLSHAAFVGGGHLSASTRIARATADKSTASTPALTGRVNGRSRPGLRA
jgi:hypothetical protein